MEVLETEETEIDGHLARIYLLRVKGSMGESCQGVIQYIRDSKQFRLRLLTEPQNGTTWEQLPKVTMADMRSLAKEVRYEPTGEDITLADGELTITAKGDFSVLSAGKKLQFTAAFADPAKVKAVDKSLEAEAINWAVADAETGETAEGVSINEKGLLTVDKNLAAAKKVIVKCGAPFFKTLAEYPLTVLPAVIAITTDPEEIVFFAGTDAVSEVKALLEPDTVPLLGIDWQLKKEGTVEMTPGEDGTATFKPLAAGKTTVTVSEPGGKKYTLKVSVVEPVTAVDLSCSGKPVPGGTVTVKAVLTPKNAGVKDVKWVLVTGAEVAEINEKGQVKISKDAPHGTLISVSCEALGASEPVYGLTAFNVE